MVVESGIKQKRLTSITIGIEGMNAVRRILLMHKVKKLLLPQRDKRLVLTFDENRLRFPQQLH